MFCSCVGTIRTIPPSSQSLAIDDLKRRYCCSPREYSSPTIYCERLALPVSLLIVIYFKATTKHEEKPPRPEPHTKIFPSEDLISMKPSYPKISCLTSFPLDLGEKHRSTSRQICHKSPNTLLGWTQCYNNHVILDQASPILPYLICIILPYHLHQYSRI